MPGRDYTRAYAKFEQSLGNSFLSSPTDSIPPDFANDWDDEQTYRTESAMINSAFRNATSTGAPSSRVNRAATPHSLRRHESGLPPTPPSKTRFSKLNGYHGAMEPLHPDRDGSTAVERSRPLTPDSTPSESAQSSPSVFAGGFPLPSSYSGSYRTAPDHFTSSQDDPNHSRCFSTHNLRFTPTPSREDALTHYSYTPCMSQVRDIGDQYTPQRTLKSKPDIDDLTEAILDSIDELESAGTSPYIPVSFNFTPLGLDFMDGNTMSSKTHDNSDSVDHDRIPPLVGGLDLRNDVKPKNRHVHQFDDISIKAARESNQIPDASRYQEQDVKRSSSSSTSTVVQAIIIDRTPPQRQRNLRHVAKARDLRDDTLTPDSPSPRFFTRAAVRPPALDIKKEATLDFRRHDSVYSTNSTSMSPQSPRYTNHGTPHPRHRRNMSSEASPRSDIFTAPRQSLEQMGIGMDDARRLGEVDSDGYHNGMTIMRRQGRHPSSPTSLHNPTTIGSTPLSFQSESYLEALSVNEATAVNIYPHHNKSLLLVEQPANGERYEGQSDDEVQATNFEPSENPETTINQVSTNPNAQPSIKIDTSLVIPSGVSDPPTLAVIPPTPAEEPDIEDPTTTFEDSPSMRALPGRESSLIRRLRQYSDTVVQPLVTRKATNTEGLLRNFQAKRQSPTSKRVDSGPIPPKAREEHDGNLHPFWQPRGFWDDVSGISDEEGTLGLDDRRPNGDDKNLVTMRSQKANDDVVPSRFGSVKGFLIGNTLGIERGPTNRRRHVVRWPTGRKRRRTASESAAGFDELVPVGSGEHNTMISNTNDMTSGRKGGTKAYNVKRMASVRESARHSAGAAQKERRRRKTRLNFTRPRWLLHAWKERLMVKKLRL